ncbi:hypothetical protein [Sorangium sp. So ce145]|uniref:hypothetical protein n=1 Tax=Sorangium sp. So ce145 TaxID=3133285 RepID=UPI003F604744
MATFLDVLMGLGLIVMVAGQIWLCISAFKTNAAWGVVVLLLPCWGALLFVVVHRKGDEAQPFIIVMAGALLAAGAGGAKRVFGQGGRPAEAGSSLPASVPPPSVTADTPRAQELPRVEALRRACEAARSQIYRGAPFPPLATEGWQVTLWLASAKGESLHDHPALVAAVSRGQLTADADEELATVTDGTAELADGLAPEAVTAAPAFRAAAIRMGGGYARAYLEDASRRRFVALADRLLTATGAEMGALYGQCAHLKTHELGSWFRGADAAGAAAALVYQMGMFSERSAVNRAVLANIDHHDELAALQKAAARMPATDLAALVARHGGALRKAPGVTITFGLGAPMRATSASRAVAGKMGVGADPN